MPHSSEPMSGIDAFLSSALQVDPTPTTPARSPSPPRAHDQRRAERAAERFDFETPPPPLPWYTEADLEDIMGPAPAQAQVGSPPRRSGPNEELRQRARFQVGRQNPPQLDFIRHTVAPNNTSQVVRDFRSPNTTPVTPATNQPKRTPAPRGPELSVYDVLLINSDQQDPEPSPFE